MIYSKFTIPPGLVDIKETNILEALIFPLSKEEFLKQIYKEKALLIKSKGYDRFSTIIEKWMFNLDLSQMVANTASEKVHLWHINPKTN